MQTIEFPKKTDPKSHMIAQFVNTPYEATACELFENARKEALEAAVESETNRLLGLVRAVFGEFEGDRFAAVVESGMSVDQYRNIRPALGESGKLQGVRLVATNMSEEVNKMNQVKDRLLGDLAQRSNDEGVGGDFMAIVERFKAEGWTNTKALSEARRQYPGAYSAYMKQQNAHIKTEDFVE